MTWIDWVFLVVTTAWLLWCIAGNEAYKMQIEQWYPFNSSQRKMALAQVKFPWFPFIAWVFVCFIIIMRVWGLK